MKGLKYFTLFFVYPVTLIIIGFAGGVTCVRVFYPGSFQTVEEKQIEQKDHLTDIGDNTDESVSGGWQVITGTPDLTDSDTSENGYLWEQAAAGENQSQNADKKDEPREAASLTQKLNAGTYYVLEETDIRNDTVVETSWKLPAKYIGMTREQFVEAMELYEASPPLEELQRGFVSLEVLSFSPQKVVVQMNYDYLQPGISFYLMVEDNFVVVYLEDKTTVYMDTDISLKDLPDDLQQEIIRVMYVPDEESLYDFLENYSS